MDKIDIENWSRKDHFHFFKKFDEPFFGFVVQVDCTRAYAVAKERGYSFFLYYLHKSLTAVNEVEAFRYRMDGNTVLIHDVAHASPTITRQDGTFGYAYFDFEKDFVLFSEKAKVEIERVQLSKGLEPAVSGENVIHYSSIPWIDFSGLSHARMLSSGDSIPKICFGKMMEDATSKRMAMSVHAHHALMDGYQVAQYIDLFQKLMNEG